MKRLILFSCALLATVMSWATVDVAADFRVVCKNGSIAYFCGSDTEMKFSEDATILYITKGSYSISYAIDGVEAIEFAEGGAYHGKYSYEASHVDVAVAASDDTSYSEVEEEVITDEENDDYGDFIENYTPKNTVTITYNGGKATCSGKPSGVNVIIDGAHVIVTSAKGKIAYTLKGTTTNGSFKLYSEKKTQITLDGVSITNPDGAAINIQSGKTMLVNLADGTVNDLEDGKEYILEDDEQQKGTFFSEGQLVFSGKGTLNVKSHYKHGIASDDYVRIRDGEFNIEAVGDGISTKDRFVMYGGELAINAGQDGVDVGEGYVEIGGGKLNVQAGDEGITASYEGDEDTGVVDPLITPYINIKGGLVKVVTTGDKGHGLRAMSTFAMSGGIIQATTKGAGSKALMSEGDMLLTGGKVTVFAEGSAFYEDGELSSSVGIRSKGTLRAENMILGVKSTGTGGKGVNNVGDIMLKNSDVTVVASGATHKSNGLDSRSRGVTTDGALVVDDGTLRVKSYDEPLFVEGVLTLSNNVVYEGYQIK